MSDLTSEEHGSNRGLNPKCSHAPVWANIALHFALIMSPHSEFEIRAATATLLRAVNTSDLQAVMSVWEQDGVMMPPGHEAVCGAPAISAYFERLFSAGRFEFAFTSSHIMFGRNVAIERVEYTALAWSDEVTEPHRDRGKGVHVYCLKPDGAWRLAMDIWNSDIHAAR